MDLYSLFIELATKLVKPNSIISYIVPDSLIGRSNFVITRQEIICKRTILKWVHINEVFESANVASLVFVAKDKPQNDYSFSYIKADSVQRWEAEDFEQTIIKKSVVEKTDGYKVNFSTETETRLLFKIRNFEQLSTKMMMWRGEELGRKSSLISTKREGNSIPLLAGDNVHRYEPITYTRFIKITDVEKRNYEKPKIVIRQLGTCINATLDTNGYITLQSIYNLAITNDDVPTLKYVIGLLNSRLYDFLYGKLSGDKQTFQRIILENIKQLPIPPAPLDQKQRIIALVNTILSKKKQSPQADTTAEEHEIDKLVYALYSLTEDEIKIVEEN